MPLKFWKREKPEKGKGEAETKKAPPKAPSVTKREPAPARPTPDAGGLVAVEEAKPEAPAEPAPPAAPPPEELGSAVEELHAGLVDLGLAGARTKDIFRKRVDAYPGGTVAFLETYHVAPYRAGTTVLAEWLALRAPADFDPAALVDELNLRLSSFKLAVQLSDVTWLDQELGLRKGRLHLGELERVVRFKDARDFVRGVNELLAPRKIVFLELETWSEDYAFLLVRDPQWDKLATSKIVVVKALQTAVGGECGECGAPVGANWHDCLSCGAVFGSE